MNELDHLFSPRSIALVGASGDATKPAGIACGNLARFKGGFYPVNPRCEELQGMVCYRSVRDIPGTVDLSVVMRPAVDVPAIVREHRGKARFILVVSAGFAETGAAGLQDELAGAGREAGVRLLGPNCLGIYNPYRRLDTFFLPPGGMRRPARGNVAIVAQSGAIVASLLDALGRARIGVSLAVNYGNAVDIDAPEIYDYLAGDASTALVVSYLESVADGRRFVAAAGRLSDAKPFLILKGGKGESGRAAAFSHTGRLAGSYEVFSSILRMAGICEIGTFDELLDATRALARQRKMPGRRVCIVTNGGGTGVVAADELLRLGFDLSPLPETSAFSLKSRFPSFYTVANPLDLTGQARDEDYRTALGEIGGAFDGFLVIALTGVAGITPGLAEILAGFRAETGKPLAVHAAQGGAGGELVLRLERRGIPVYPTPERAVRGLRALLEVAR